MSLFSCFLYGMCVMFYSMMAWIFWRKGGDVLSRLIMVIMLVVDVECFKDIAFYLLFRQLSSGEWEVMTSLDIVIIPIYAFVLMELVKPGWLTWKKGVVHEMPFVVLPFMFVVTGADIWFYTLTVWGALYGCTTFVLTFFWISRYHEVLKSRFSYQEDINLHWLRGILVCFFVILLVWMGSCFMTDANFDNAYMVSSLALWMFISYFVYKHESVLDELSDIEEVVSHENDGDATLPQGLAQTVQKLFIEDKLYLNPKLKLSDVARLVGTNRTYLSRYFNQDNGQTFYDYVNNLRVKHAEKLLQATSNPIISVGELSGFNSLTTFRRVFMGHYGCSPAEYRKIHKKS